MITFLALCNLAFVCDALLGEPPNSCHPVAWFGRCAQWMEKSCRAAFGNGIVAGAIAWICLTLPLPALAALAVSFLQAWSPLAALAAAIVLCYFTIALRSLTDHAECIRKALCHEDLPRARQALSMIVTRDTAQLDESEIIRGGIESVGENLIDAVTSSWFWIFLGFVVCGLPGAVFSAIFLRAVNTLDACWGYKNDRYLYFGRVAARIDDLAHYIPARLTMIAIALAAPLLKGSPLDTLRKGWRHRKDHPSPNSGFGMASFAGALRIRLGGPTVYRNELEEYPYWGDGRSELNRDDLKRAEWLAWYSCVIFLILLEGGYVLWQLNYY